MGATMVGLAPLLRFLAHFGARNEGMHTALLWLSGASLDALVVYVL